jgi:small subunit ribosomal protein S7
MTLKITTVETRFDVFFKKCINLMMKDGKKLKASKIFFTTILILKNRLKKDLEKKNQREISLKITLLRLISQALENITPSLEVRKVRVAGSTYLVPSILSKKKQETLALKWLLEAAKKRKKNSNTCFAACLADEILDASKKAGHARQKRDELHRVAQANRASLRYRWW